MLVLVRLGLFLRHLLLLSYLGFTIAYGTVQVLDLVTLFLLPNDFDRIGLLFNHDTVTPSFNGDYSKKNIV